MPWLLLFFLTLCAQEDRNFHKMTIQQVTAEQPGNWKHPLTHIEVEGYVLYKAHEGDGDWHLRLCDDLKFKMMDRTHCLVAEIIPELPLTVPKIKAKVRIDGIYRYDGENPGHHWAEVHPVLKIEVLQ